MGFMEARCFWTGLLVAIVPVARGLWLDLPSSGSKCVSEELNNHVVVLGYYHAFIREDYDGNNTIKPHVTFKITSPFGNELYHQQNSSHGEFAFTTNEIGNYVVCFSPDRDHHGKKVTVGIEWKTGIAAKDWESVARKEKIEGLELELKKLEEHVEAIHQNLNDLMNREAGMREVSEMTNSRVARYSITSLSLCVVVSIIQVWYLRRYFQKKKLI